MRFLPVLAVFLLAADMVAANSQAASTGADHLLQQPSSQARVALKPAAPALAVNYGKLPLSFEENRGQSDPQVKFLSRGDGYSLFLTASGAVLSLTKASRMQPHRRGPDARKKAMPEAKPTTTDLVRMELAGASSGLKVAGEQQLPGTANYFLGNDPKKWHSGMPTYAKVKYSAVYPGIDLVYYGNQRVLEYDFMVSPEADPERAKLHFAGARGLRLTADGDLEVVARNGEIAFHKPIVYQEIDGQRHTVDGRFRLLARNTVGFSLGKYDRHRALVIDPTLAYSTYLGGGAKSQVNAIAVDPGGSAYVTGFTLDGDFPLVTAFQGSIINQGASVAFVSKLTPAGDALVYSTYLGGTSGPCTNPLQNSGDVGNAIAVDGSGDAYVTGLACSTDFPTVAAYQAVNHGSVNGNRYNSNAFVAKLNASGTALSYSTFLGGTGSVFAGDFGEAIAVDSSGDAYVTGLGYSGGVFPFPSPSAGDLLFPTTNGAYQTVNLSGSTGGSDPFIAKLSADGSALLFSTYFGGEAGTSANAIAVDSQGAVFVTGETLSMSNFATNGAFQTANNEQGYPTQPTGNAYVIKLAPSGNSVVYATYLGGSSFPNASLFGDIGLGIAVDRAGSAYVGGFTYSHDFPLKAPFQMTDAIAVGHPDGFVAKLTPNGSNLVYSTYLGGNFDGAINNIQVDAFGDAYVSGFTYADAGTFPVTSDAYQSTNNGSFFSSDGTFHLNYNAFFTELNPGANALIYSTLLGGKGNQSASLTGDAAVGLARDPSGNVYLAGYTQSMDFPITSNSFARVDPAAGGISGFISKFSGVAATTSGLQFIPVTPCRVVDTRGAAGAFGGPELGAGAQREFDLPQSGCGIPSSAVAYSLNVTAVPDGPLAYLTLWPSGQALPNVSTLNSDGRVKANAAITPAGSNGGVSVFTSDPSQVIVDIDGYFVPAGSSSALSFYPTTPCRIADTRGAAGPLGGPFVGGGTSRDFPVLSSSCGLPASAAAYSLNITAIPHATLNYLTTWPTGQPQPNASTLNATTGAVTANAAIVPAGAGGGTSIFVSDDADVIVDVNGYFAAPDSGGLSLYTDAPCRVVDTRPTAISGAVSIDIVDSSCAPPTGAQAYVLNATVVPEGPLVYLSLWPDGQGQPNVSTLNAPDGATTSNMAIVPVTDGSIDAFADGNTNLILDLSSYFAP